MAASKWAIARSCQPASLRHAAAASVKRACSISSELSSAALRYADSAASRAANGRGSVGAGYRCRRPASELARVRVVAGGSAGVEEVAPIPLRDFGPVVREGRTQVGRGPQVSRLLLRPAQHHIGHRADQRLSEGVRPRSGESLSARTVSTLVHQRAQVVEEGGSRSDRPTAEPCEYHWRPGASLGPRSRAVATRAVRRGTGKPPSSPTRRSSPSAKASVEAASPFTRRTVPFGPLPPCAPPNVGVCDEAVEETAHDLSDGVEGERRDADAQTPRPPALSPGEAQGGRWRGL